MYGAVVCSWGLHASLVADSDTTEYRKHGSKRFAMAANEILSPSDGSSSHVYKGVVTPIGDNDKTMKPLAEHEHMYILATMVSNLEQKLNISPLSRPLDGQMRLLHFGPMSAERVMDIMGMYHLFFVSQLPGLRRSIPSSAHNLLPRMMWECTISRLRITLKFQSRARVRA